MPRRTGSFQDARLLELETNSRLSRGARLRLLVSMTNFVERIKGTAWQQTTPKRHRRR